MFKQFTEHDVFFVHFLSLLRILIFIIVIVMSTPATLESNLRKSCYSYQLLFPPLSKDNLVIVSFFTYQDILPVFPWSILHFGHVHFHSAVAQLTFYCVFATWSDSEVKTITLAFIFTQIVTFYQKMDVMTRDPFIWRNRLVSCW